MSLYRIKRALQRTGITAAGTAVGAGIAYGATSYLRYVADINVRIRPELANLNWFEALFTEHFGDWFWYANGDVSQKIAIGGVAALAGIITYYLSE